jgi:GAF domain-containing protein
VFTWALPERGIPMVDATGWAFEMLRGAKTVDEVENVLRSSARAAIGADGCTVVRREHDTCYYSQEDAMSPLWQGQRFPLKDCISGWSMLNRQAVTIPDVELDERIPQQAYRPTFVRSLLMVPVDDDEPVGAIGIYWADEHTATPTEITAVKRLAGAAAAAFARIRSERSDNRTPAAH